MEHGGKAKALNSGAARATGEIIVFTDARQIIQPDALENLIANFADPNVGCVSGELIIDPASIDTSSHGVGLYWQMEKKVRLWEALSGSTVGATGAFYAVRRTLFWPIPPATILDDVYIPLQVARQGQRVIFEPRAIVRDDFKPSSKQEFQRKVRTLLGNYQLLQLAPWILTSVNPVRVQFICHKLLRLLVPFGLFGLLLSAICLRKGIYGLAFVFQLAFYSLAGLSVFRAKRGIIARMSAISTAFIVLNAAAVVAFVYFITGRKAVWAP